MQTCLETKITDTDGMHDLQVAKGGDDQASTIYYKSYIALRRNSEYNVSFIVQLARDLRMQNLTALLDQRTNHLIVFPSSCS